MNLHVKFHRVFVCFFSPSKCESYHKIQIWNTERKRILICGLYSSVIQFGVKFAALQSQIQSLLSYSMLYNYTV